MMDLITIALSVPSTSGSPLLHKRNLFGIMAYDLSVPSTSGSPLLQNADVSWTRKKNLSVPSTSGSPLLRSGSSVSFLTERSFSPLYFG